MLQVVGKTMSLCFVDGCLGAEDVMANSACRTGRAGEGRRGEINKRRLLVAGSVGRLLSVQGPRSSIPEKLALDQSFSDRAMLFLR